MCHPPVVITPNGAQGPPSIGTELEQIPESLPVEVGPLVEVAPPVELATPVALADVSVPARSP